MKEKKSVLDSLWLLLILAIVIPFLFLIIVYFIGHYTSVSEFMHKSPDVFYTAIDLFGVLLGASVTIYVMKRTIKSSEELSENTIKEREKDLVNDRMSQLYSALKDARLLIALDGIGQVSYETDNNRLYDIYRNANLNINEYKSELDKSLSNFKNIKNKFKNQERAESIIDFVEKQQKELDDLGKYLEVLFEKVRSTKKTEINDIGKSNEYKGGLMKEIPKRMGRNNRFDYRPLGGNNILWGIIGAHSFMIVENNENIIKKFKKEFFARTEFEKDDLWSPLEINDLKKIGR